MSLSRIVAISPAAPAKITLIAKVLTAAIAKVLTTAIARMNRLDTQLLQQAMDGLMKCLLGLMYTARRIVGSFDLFLMVDLEQIVPDGEHDLGIGIDHFILFVVRPAGAVGTCWGWLFGRCFFFFFFPVIVEEAT